MYEIDSEALGELLRSSGTSRTKVREKAEICRETLKRALAGGRAGLCRQKRSVGEEARVASGPPRPALRLRRRLPQRARPRRLGRAAVSRTRRAETIPTGSCPPAREASRPGQRQGRRLA